MEEEWRVIEDFKARPYRWAPLAKKYKVSVSTIKRVINGRDGQPYKVREG